MRLLDVFHLGAANAQQIDMNPNKGFVHDMQPGLGQKAVHIGHPPIGGVFHRQHAQIHLAGLGFLDHLFEGDTRNRLKFRACLLAGLMGIGAQLSLKSDSADHFATLRRKIPQIGAIGRASTP
jgi:hypothetical protein